MAKAPTLAQRSTAALSDIDAKSWPVDKFTPSGQVFYALVAKGVVQQYPVDPGANPTASADALDGYVPVCGMVRPPFDPLTETMTEGKPEIVGGVWTQTWALAPLVSG